MRSLFCLTLLIFAMVASSGCEQAAEADPDEQQNAAAPEITGKWSVKSMTLNGEKVALPAGAPFTISFQGNRFHGTGDCNSYDGTFKATADGGFQTQGAGWTEIGCAGIYVEEKYSKLLNVVDTFQATADQLVLSDGTARNQIVYVPFQAAKPLPLAGTAWTLETFEEEFGAGEAATVSATPTLREAKITLLIEDDKASGSAGCNRYHTKVTIDEGQLSIGPLALTRKACGEEVNRQEQRYVTLLKTITRFEIAGDQLRLYTDDGKQTLHFTGKQGE